MMLEKHKEFLNFIYFHELKKIKKNVYLEDHSKRLFESLQFIRKHIVDGIDILSIGVGSAYLEIALSHCFDMKVSVYDFDETIRKNIEKYSRYNFETFSGDFTLGLNDFLGKKFDLIIMGELVEHVPISPRIQFDMVKSILKPNGLLFISTPNFTSIVNCIKMLRGENVVTKAEKLFLPVSYINEHIHRREYSMYELKDAFIESGFSCVDKSYTWGHYPRTWKELALFFVEILIKRWRPFIFLLGKINK